MASDSKILILEPDLYLPGEVRQYFGDLGLPYLLTDTEHGIPSDEEILEVAYIVIARRRFFEKDFMTFPSLKAVVKWGRGVERIDLNAATERGVLIAYAPYAIQGVAEAALLLMLALSKNLVQQVRAAKQGEINDKWAGVDLGGKSLGIIGFGSIGQALARMAAGIGMTILVYTLESIDSNEYEYDIHSTSLENLVSEADYVSLHATASQDGYPILTAELISKMKSSAFLINTARGSLIDEGALVQALISGKIAGAGLDVVAQEPVQSDNPLLHMKNVIVTPHMLGFTKEARKSIKQGVHQALRFLIAGDIPPHIANPEIIPRYTGKGV